MIYSISSISLAVYFEYDILNFSIHDSTSTQNVLKVSAVTDLVPIASNIECRFKIGH